MNTYFKFVLIFVLMSFNGIVIAAAEKADAGTNSGGKGMDRKVYVAAKEGQLATLKAMLANGANVNASNAKGRSALMGAVYYRNRGIIRELLSEGADVDAVDVQGKTALMIAVANQDIEIIRDLLNAGADVSVKDKKEESALTLAEKIKNKKIIKLLDSASE